MARVPAKGAVVAVANHPFGMLEGAVLGSALTAVRPGCEDHDEPSVVRTRGTTTRLHLRRSLPSSRFSAGEYRSLKEAIRWLRSGGLLVIFQAGEVSHWDFAQNCVADPEWSETVARLIGITRAAALPIFINGRNSVLFQLLGLVHPNLRTASLPAEFLNKRGKKVDVRIRDRGPASPTIRKRCGTFAGARTR